MPDDYCEVLMKYGSALGIGSALVLGLSLALTGCSRAPSEAPAAAPIPITVSYPGHGNHRSPW